MMKNVQLKYSMPALPVRRFALAGGPARQVKCPIINEDWFGRVLKGTFEILHFILDIKIWKYR